MKIIGVDPGYDRLGIAVLNKTNGAEQLLYSHCVVTNKNDTLSNRLLFIANAYEQCIKKFQPTHAVIESLFFLKNQKTALYVAESKGVISYLSARYNLRIKEFTPLEIKQLLTGYGRADKKQMIHLIDHLLTLKKKVRYDDEYDAIAAALAGAAFFSHPLSTTNH